MNVDYGTFILQRKYARKYRTLGAKHSDKEGEPHPVLYEVTCNHQQARCVACAETSTTPPRTLHFQRAGTKFVHPHYGLHPIVYLASHVWTCKVARFDADIV